METISKIGSLIGNCIQTDGESSTTTTTPRKRTLSEANEDLSHATVSPEVIVRKIIKNWLVFYLVCYLGKVT